MVTLSEILEYLGERKRPLVEGEAVFKAGHLFLCGYSAPNKVMALCTRSSTISSSPHEINIHFVGPNVSTWTCECSCKAGLSGYCKHVVATLIFLNRNEIDSLGCTDLKQIWGKQKAVLANTYSAREVTELCHGAQKTRKPIVTTPELMAQNWQLLINCNPASAIHRTLINPPKTATSILERCDDSSTVDNNANILLHHMKQQTSLQFITVDTNNIGQCCETILQNLKSHGTIIDSCVQGSEEWQQLRQLRVTGSRCHSIYTYQKLDWERKSVSYFWPKSFTSKFTQHGKKYESEAREQYLQENPEFAVYVPAFIVCPRACWIGYSPDGILFENNVPTKLLEIKCPYSGLTAGPESFMEMEYLEVNADNRLSLKTRHQYYSQIQLGMAVLNLESADLFLYAPYTKSGITVSVKFDQNYATQLINITSEKYLRHMLHNYCLNKKDFN